MSATAPNEYPDRTVYDPGGDVYYVPYVSVDGRVGYRVSRSDGRAETFVYLNPSMTEGGSPDVFLYIGIEDDPALDTPRRFFTFPELEVDA